jgi:hypothetical protein
MLADFVIELVAAPGVGTLALPGVAPAGRLTWASQYPIARTVLYVLDDTTKEEWGIGTYTPGSPGHISRDTVLGNSSGTTAKLNFAGSGCKAPPLRAVVCMPPLLPPRLLGEEEADARLILAAGVEPGQSSGRHPTGGPYTWR